MTANSFRNQPPARANSLRQQPDSRGHFGAFGGRYVAEPLMPLILHLEREYRAAKADPAFRAAFDDLLDHYVVRPRPPSYAARLTDPHRHGPPAGIGRCSGGGSDVPP